MGVGARGRREGVGARGRREGVGAWGRREGVGGLCCQVHAAITAGRSWWWLAGKCGRVRFGVKGDLVVVGRQECASSWGCE